MLTRIDRDAPGDFRLAADRRVFWSVAEEKRPQTALGEVFPVKLVDGEANDELQAEPDLARH